MNPALRKVVLIAAAVAVVSLGIATILFFTTNIDEAWGLKGGITVEERKTFPLDEVTEITVRSSSTDVLVERIQGNTIDVHLHGTVYSGRPQAVPALVVEQEGELLTVATEKENGRQLALGFYYDDLILKVGLPKQYRGSLLVRASSGDVNILEQDLARLSAETSSGEIRLRSVQAVTVSLKSSSGDQAAESLDAEQLTLTSLSGDILVKDLRGGTRAESSSGEITLKYRKFDADLVVQSSSGDVDLYLTDAARFRLEGKSSSGDIRCEFPVTLAGASSEMSRNSVVGMIGDGTHQVVVRTASGDITIRP